jgi:ribose-phosphate pyrophosphokinase
MTHSPAPLLFAPHHTRAFGERVARALQLELSLSEEKDFEAGEHRMRPQTSVRGRDVYVIHGLCGEATASANDKLCRLLFFIGALRDAGAARITACMPYLAYARKDRRTKPSDPVTTRYVAQLFEAMRTDRVVVFEIHNESAFDNAFRCQTARLEAASLFAEHLAAKADLTNLTVVSPDTGGAKRAERFRKVIESKGQHKIGTAFMEKYRSDGRLTGERLVGDVAGRDIVVFDDLIASGSTIMRTVHAARAAGARRVYACAAHAVFSPPAVQLFGADGPDSVMISDSVTLTPPFANQPAERLQVCSAAPLFAEVIGRLYRDEALDELAM